MTTLNLHRVDASYRSGEAWDVTAEALAAYRDATLDGARRDAPVAPVGYAIVPTWPIIQQMLADTDLGIDQTRCVQGEERVELFEPIRAGDRLSSLGRLARIERRGPHEVLTLHLTTSNQAGRIVAAQDVVCVIRGDGDSNQRPERASQEPPMPDIEDVVQLPHDLALRYAAASGDGSPIHTDDAFARSAGFPSTVMQGMCLLAIGLRPIDAAAEPVRCVMSVRFTRPALPGDTVRFRRWHLPSVDRFKAVDARGRTILEGFVNAPRG